MKASIISGALFLAALLALDGCSATQDQVSGLDAETPQHIEDTVFPLSEDTSKEARSSMRGLTESSAVNEIKNLPEFEGFGKLLFPTDRPVDGSSTLSDLASDGTFIWYSNLQADVFAKELESLRKDAASGERIFYPIYSSEEIAADSSLENTGLFFFRGDPGAPFAIVNAGGGFAYVAALHDSFPVSLELSESGYNAFALIYRVGHPYDDLARAIEYVHDNALALEVDPNGYSLWGGSAGARMAATLGNRSALLQLSGRDDIPQASMVVTQYTGLSSAYPDDAPTYACVGTNDDIANWRTMQSRLKALAQMGIPAEFHEYQGLNHGFGLGAGTAAEGWIDDALRFWDANRK